VIKKGIRYLLDLGMENHGFFLTPAVIIYESLFDQCGR